jgi:nicotinamidase-related amidase
MKYTEPELSHSVLVTIDSQNDFALPGAPAVIAGTYDILPRMVKLLKQYRERGLPIIHIVRLYLPDGSNVDLCRKEKIESGYRIVCPHSSGAELVAELKADPSLRLDSDTLLQKRVQYWSEKEVVIYKSRWGAFYQTSLEDHLQSLGASTLVFCGCNFPNCPRTSIYEASERDYRIVLVEDAVSGLYQKGREEMENIGVCVWTTDILIENLNRIA